MGKWKGPEGSNRGHGFDVNPQNINRDGNNRYSFAAINKILEERGIEPLKKSELIRAYELIFSTPEAELDKLLKTGEEVPIAWNIIVQELKDPKLRAKAWDQYREWVYGKAATKVEVTSNVGVDVKDIIAGAFGKPEKDDKDEGE